MKHVRRLQECDVIKVDFELLSSWTFPSCMLLTEISTTAVLQYSPHGQGECLKLGKNQMTGEVSRSISCLYLVLL